MRGELLDARRRIRAFEAEVDSLRDENARLRERVRLAETAPAAEWDAARGTWHAVTDWAVERATALPEVWALVAEHSGLVGAWRVMRVCKAARQGAKEYLSTLPGLVVCGGFTGGGGATDDVWRLDLATLRWGPMPSLVPARYVHAGCAVRGNIVVLGGMTTSGGSTSSVSMLSSEEGGRSWISRRCHAAGSEVQPRSRWKRARAPRGRCSCSEERCRVRQCRRCTWSIWPLACAHPAGLTYSARAIFFRPLGC
jgi:hypothetical protein